MNKISFKSIATSLSKITDDMLKMAGENITTEYTLDDNSKVSIEGELANGSIVLQDGKPINDGEYHLEDGSLLRCQNGIITEYIEKKEASKTDEKNQEKENVQDTQQKAEEQVKESLSTTVKLLGEMNSAVDRLDERIKLSDEAIAKRLDSLQTTVEKLESELKTEKELNAKLQKDVDILCNRSPLPPTVLTGQPKKDVDRSKMSLSQRLAHQAMNK